MYIFCCAKGSICLEKYQFKILVTFLPIFVADTEMIFGGNFVAPWNFNMENLLNDKGVFPNGLNLWKKQSCQ